MIHDDDAQGPWSCCWCGRPLLVHDLCVTRVVQFAGELDMSCTACCQCEVHRAQAQDQMPGTVIWRRRDDAPA